MVETQVSAVRHALSLVVVGLPAHRARQGALRPSPHEPNPLIALRDTSRQQYQGIEAPVDRSEDNFDPGSKYHTIASVPYIG